MTATTMTIEAGDRASRLTLTDAYPACRRQRKVGRHGTCYRVKAGALLPSWCATLPTANSHALLCLNKHLRSATNFSPLHFDVAVVTVINCFNLVS
jgi:hypothetical protein